MRDEIPRSPSKLLDEIVRAWNLFSLGSSVLVLRIPYRLHFNLCFTLHFALSLILMTRYRCKRVERIFYFVAKITSLHFTSLAVCSGPTMSCSPLWWQSLFPRYFANIVLRKCICENCFVTVIRENCSLSSYTYEFILNKLFNLEFLI